MSDFLDTLQQQHQERLDQLRRGEVDEAFLDGVQALLTDLRQAGVVIADPAERGQLRALMHFWGNVIYDHTDVYPDTMLQPLDPTRAPPAEEPARRPSPPLTWVLVGGAAVIIIAVGLAAIGWLPRMIEGPEETPTPTLTPAPFVVGSAAVGAELSREGTLEMTADTFCLGVPEIVAEFALDGIEPEMVWYWEVRREGEREPVAARMATPWGQEQQPITVRVLTGGPAGVEPGQYELLVYADRQVVGTHSFRVLDVATRVFSLRVSDVPELAEEASDKRGGNEFEAGVRVIYLSYEYEGMCPGLDVSHALYYHEEGSIQESVETWGDASQGQAQVSFQAPGDLPFSPGDYEVAVAVAGEGPALVGLTVREATLGGVPPAFGEITIALGVQPDGTPILTAPDNRFDWNTKMVYAIFDYVGMSDGLAWTAVWTGNGEEVARQEEFWNVEDAGTAGTRWVAYYNERGRVLPNGSYNVTLYIGNVAQRTADFNILYYVSSE
ncbi:MAG: hypothetical protein ISS49_09140 [Anaerolineae bacterium]|nr:hypothetical protein [Anaerolineae bacterium]